jgi:hypothetical protein
MAASRIFDSVIELKPGNTSATAAVVELNIYSSNNDIAIVDLILI